MLNGYTNYISLERALAIDIHALRRLYYNE